MVKVAVPGELEAVVNVPEARLAEFRTAEAYTVQLWAGGRQYPAQLRELSPAQISELMHVSDKIGGLNAARFGSWTPAFTPANVKQALLAFKGDVYTGLNAETFTDAGDGFTEGAGKVKAFFFVLLLSLMAVTYIPSLSLFLPGLFGMH